MCIFSTLVSSVADTKIFARSSTGEKQFLVYSMQYEAGSDLAMILPLPTPISPAEDAVRFVDLSNYSHFFLDLQKGFPQPQTRMATFSGPVLSKSILQVHDVGSFEASFVAHRTDFVRLDSRFRLPDNVWDQLPLYDDYAFAVFKLKAGARSVHPMAFEFPRRNVNELFFPTVHVHHGKVKHTAHFDHGLYCQADHPLVDWEFSSSTENIFEPLAAKHFMDIARTQGIVAPEIFVQMKRIYGMYPNKDIVVLEHG